MVELSKEDKRKFEDLNKLIAIEEEKKRVRDAKEKEEKDRIKSEKIDREFREMQYKKNIEIEERKEEEKKEDDVNYRLEVEKKTDEYLNDLRKDNLEKPKFEKVVKKVVDEVPIKKEYDLINLSFEDELKPKKVISNDSSFEDIERIIDDKIKPLRNTLKELLNNLIKNKELFGRVDSYIEYEREKNEKVKDGLKSYETLIRETTDKEKEIDSKKTINLADFTSDEIIAIRNVLEKKIGEYQHDLREINLTSDIVIDKLKVYRMSRRMMTYVMNIINDDEITYKKIKKLIEPTEKFNDKLVILYDEYLDDKYLRDVNNSVIGKIIHENEEDVNRLIDVFLSILDKQDRIEFLDIIGIKVKNKEALELIEYINEK